MSKVYCLTDPRTNEIRYVGGTNGSLEKRLREHIRGVQSADTHKGYWMRSLLADGIKPEIHLLEEVDGPFSSAECEWISCFRHMKMRLTNLTDGGDGTVGYRHTQEQRDKNAAAKRGVKRQPFTDGTRLKMSESRKGHTPSVETREKMAEAKRGKKLSAEHKAKIGSASLGKAYCLGRTASAETKQKMADSHTGTTHTPESRLLMSEQWHSKRALNKRNI
jgi:hypothetical protein